MPDVSAVSRCFVAKMTGWIGHEGTLARLEAPSPAALREARQKTMTFALAAAKWTEFAALSPDDAVETMHRWLDATESRATVRGATARAEAAALARSWLAACSAESHS
jgi:hypothetical protein